MNQSDRDLLKKFHGAKEKALSLFGKLKEEAHALGEEAKLEYDEIMALWSEKREKPKRASDKDLRRTNKDQLDRLVYAGSIAGYKLLGDNEVIITLNDEAEISIVAVPEGFPASIVVGSELSTS